MRLGIGTYCYMWSLGMEGAMPSRPMPAAALLDEALRLSVGVVQYGPNRPLTRAEEEQIGSMAADHGILLERGTTGFNPQTIARELDLCQRWGCSLLRTVDLYEGPTPDPATFERRLCELLPLLEHSGVCLAIENARMPARAMAAVLDTIGSPLLGITLDTVNSLAIPEGTAEVVQHLARHTLCLHVKDFQIRRIWHSMGFEVTGTPAGEGQLDIPWVLAQIGDGGRDPNAILELWVPQQESPEATAQMELDWVDRSIPKLREWITG